MGQGADGSCRNRLLAGLSQSEMALLAPHLEPIDLPLRLILERPNEPIEHIVFPSSGVASLVAVGPDGQRIEVGLFGREGMSGLAVVLGGDRSPHELVIQLDGAGHRIASDALRKAMEDPGLRKRLLRYAQAFWVQTAHTALANGRHTIEERLARWLLMCHDRIDGDALDLTHEFLSTILGTRRAGITVATHVLEGQGLIKATRGCIRILDRAGLESVVLGLYGVPEAEYSRLLGDYRPMSRILRSVAAS